ncbi:MAG: Aminotransferase [Candidatus Saccharibacteria bacterium]|nr:Aminotransferase [Candidatus Saccharibacteria bacterium]
MNYFDYAAATPMSPTVLAAMQPYFTDAFYNPSAQYLAAQDVRKAIEKARSDVAVILGARTPEIIFTAGGTEANNLAIHGVMARYPEANCVVSAVEHDAVLEPAGQYDCRFCPVKPDGRIDLDALKNLIDDKTVLVSVMYANNEIGTVQPLAQVAKILREMQANRTKNGNTLPLYFHTDACQAPNYLQILPNTLGVDMMTLNGGKIYGPKQSGVLFVKSGIELEPLVRGGGQERNLRSGTENVAGIVGFAAALKEAHAIRETESARLSELLHTAVNFITKEMPSAVLNGAFGYRLPNNLHITFPGADNERLMMCLDEQGFQVAVGSACSASSDEPSHVLKAIGMSDADAQSSLRITMGRQTTREEILELLKACKDLISK